MQWNSTLFQMEKGSKQSKILNRNFLNKQTDF